MPTPRRMTPMRRVLVVLVTTLVTAAAMMAAVVVPAAADPASASGWMPPQPPALTSEQKSWLKPLDGAGDNDDKYVMISCSEHPDFAGCAKHEPSEQSKDVDAYVFNAADNSYAGVKAMVPEQLAREHRDLLDDNGVLDCEKARNKIPACGNPAATPKPAQFDEQGRFIKLTEGGTAEGETSTDLSALNPANAGKEMLDNWFAQACETVGKFAGDLLVLSMTWWLKTDSIDVTSGGILAGERPVQILVMMVLALGIISTAITMALSRRPGPAAELGVGAFKFIMICSLSGIVVTGALHAADDFARQITASGAEDFGPNMKAMLGISVIKNPGGVLFLGMVAAIISAVQWLIGFARQAGLVILFAMLIFAAAGQVSSWGRQWFPRITAMMLALILYKPFAAALYSIGFKLMGNEQSLSSIMVGIMTIGLCIVALPALMAFFKWVSPGAAGGASAATMLAGGGALAAAGIGQFSGGGGAGGDAQSNYMDSTGPSSSASGPEADPSPGNSAGGFGTGGGSGGGGEGGSSAGGEAAGGSVPEADLGSGDFGPASESPDAGGGVPVAGGSADPSGAAAGADGAASGAAGAEAGAAGAGAANPYVAGAMFAKEGLDSAAGAAEGLAGEATGDSDDTGPAMT